VRPIGSSKDRPSYLTTRSWDADAAGRGAHEHAVALDLRSVSSATSGTECNQGSSTGRASAPSFTRATSGGTPHHPLVEKAQLPRSILAVDRAATIGASNREHRGPGT